MLDSFMFYGASLLLSRMINGCFPLFPYNVAKIFDGECLWFEEIVMKLRYVMEVTSWIKMTEREDEAFGKIIFFITFETSSCYKVVCWITNLVNAFQSFVINFYDS